MRRTLSAVAVTALVLSIGSTSHADEELVVHFDDDAGVACEKGVCRGPGQAVAALNDAIVQGAMIRPCYDVDRDLLTTWRQVAITRSGRALADLTQCHVLSFPSAGSRNVWRARWDTGKPPMRAVYPMPRPGVPAQPSEDSPDLRGDQFWLVEASEGGMGIAGFWDAYDVLGAGTTTLVIDINFPPQGHEDLPTAADALDYEGAGTPFVTSEDALDHGIAALGLIAAAHNDAGIDGIAPDTRPIFMTYLPEEYTRRVGPTLLRALQHLEPGDVVLIEVQVDGPNWTPSSSGDDHLVPPEYFLIHYDAIATATALGITVIEVGGNGGEDLDGGEFDGRFDRSRRDSGAIVVCAGGRDRTAASYTNYGSRCDVQAFGSGLSTVGYGDAHNGGPRALYTASFGGTSGAAPLVAGVAVLLQSLARQMGGVLLPEDLRQLLIDTGQPQSGGRAVGPLPDAVAAGAGVAALVSDAPSSPDLPGPGQRCTDSCADGAVCDLFEGGDSYCLHLCEPFAEDCGAGRTCALQPSGRGLCQWDSGIGGPGAACVANAQCRSNLFCQEGSCRRYCSTSRDAGCGAGGTCVFQGGPFGDVGICDETIGGSGADDGDSCQSGDDCRGGRCVAQWTGGYCATSCQSEAECSGDAVCVSLGGYAQCLASCGGDGDCRDGYTCQSGACLPPLCDIDDDQCPEPSRCVADVFRDGQPRCAAAEPGGCNTDADCVAPANCIGGECVDPEGPGPDVGTVDTGAPDAGSAPSAEVGGDSGCCAVAVSSRIWPGDGIAAVVLVLLTVLLRRRRR